jgi:Na+/melibiose symporter-like transporter
LLTGISYIALIVTTVVMPLYFQTILKVTPFDLWFVASASCRLLSITQSANWQTCLDAVGPKRVVLIGMSLITGGFLLLTILLAGHLPLIVAILVSLRY